MNDDLVAHLRGQNADLQANLDIERRSATADKATILVIAKGLMDLADHLKVLAERLASTVD